MSDPIKWDEDRHFFASVKTDWGRYWVNLDHKEDVPGGALWHVEVEALGRGGVTLLKRDGNQTTLSKAKLLARALMLQMEGPALERRDLLAQLDVAR